MITLYRVCLWFARFDLTMAETVQNYDWMTVARADVIKFERLVEDAELRRRFGC